MAEAVLTARMEQAMKDSKVILFDPVDSFSPTLITPKMARGRTFTGFTEIRIKQSVVECDFLMSNGTLQTSGTFAVNYSAGDEVSDMAEAVTKALGDAFKKFERMKT